MDTSTKEMSYLDGDRGLMLPPHDYSRGGQRLSFCRPNGSDAEVMARVVSASGEAPLISSENASGVSPEVVKGWWGLAEVALVVRLNRETVAMGTLSTREAPLAEGTVELCHLFVVPERRREYNGSHLVQEMMGIVRRSCFRRVIGRVMWNNYIAREFFQSLRWSVTRGPGSMKGNSFVWYERMV